LLLSLGSDALLLLLGLLGGESLVDLGGDVLLLLLGLLGGEAPLDLGSDMLLHVVVRGLLLSLRMGAGSVRLGLLLLGLGGL